MDNEAWRPVPDFPNYEISNLCRVRNSRGKILRAIYDPSCRYVRYCFRYEGHQLTKNAHRVMWRAFYGEIPAGLQLNHIDGNRQNNAMGNLELVTPSENGLHAARLGLLASGNRHHARRTPEVMARGERHGQAKLTEAQVREILRLKGYATDIARQYGVSATQIKDIRRGKTWKHVTQPQR